MSASVGPAVSVANLEHPLHDLANRRQRVELTVLHLVEQPTQLGIVGDGTLEMRFCPRRCDGEDLSREVLAPPLLEDALALEERAVLFDLGPELRHVLAPR